jgi:hypothetical protein
MSEGSAIELPEVVTIGPCHGCRQRRILRENACEECRNRLGEHCDLAFQKTRTVEQESTIFVRSDGMDELEQHVCAVLLTRKSRSVDLMRAAGMLRALWPRLTPERWAVLLQAVRLHKQPEILHEMIRPVGEGNPSLDHEQLAADLRLTVEQARLDRLPQQVGALLCIAARVGVAAQMKADHLLWALPQAPESIECLTRWVWAHPHDTSFVETADCVSRSSKLGHRSEPRRGVSWVALWQQPSRQRWSRYAFCFADMNRPEPQCDPTLEQHCLAEWLEAVEEVISDGPVRAVVERRPNGRSSLHAASFSDPDPFVRAVLASWVNHDLAGTWKEEADVENGW